MMGLPTGVRIWLVAGVTDMRKGMAGLCALVQTALGDSPFVCAEL
jgi:transposase